LFDTQLFDQVKLSLPDDDDLQQLEPIVDVYTRAELNLLRGSGKELYPRAIYHGYSTKRTVSHGVSISRIVQCFLVFQDMYLIEFLLGKPHVELEVARRFCLEGKTKRKRIRTNVTRDRSGYALPSKKDGKSIFKIDLTEICFPVIEQSAQGMTPEQKHPIWYRQLKNALFDDPAQRK
jgi:hypothetical protein